MSKTCVRAVAVLLGAATMFFADVSSRAGNKKPQRRIVEKIVKIDLREQESQPANIEVTATGVVPTSGFTDVQLALANTEYLNTTITFLPVFATNINSNQQADERASTTLYSTAYLRNKRRG